jgi:UDP-glucose:(heptosyl)LPS alpha-1,3-glucosyltransferase
MTDTKEDTMDVALCYENVNPGRGGCETYIADLSRRLSREGHRVHLYACAWDESRLPLLMHYHRLPAPKGPRPIRPWQFAASCADALANAGHDVSIGFDKTWGQDILYPQGGLHAASMVQNALKHPPGVSRLAARWLKRFDPAARSFAKLERKQYLGTPRPRIVVNSKMVQSHFETHYDIPAEEIDVLHAAIDPSRFHADDRLKRRATVRDGWAIRPETPVGLFVAMNYRLKGLRQLIEAMPLVKEPVQIVVVGHPKFHGYQQLAQRLGVADRIHFAGFHADTRDCYFAADFLVHPTFYDPCSLVVLEALACGLPPITTRFNGAAELYVAGEEGLVVDDPHEKAALAAAISQLGNNGLRARMTAAARKAGERWTFEMHYQKFITLMQRVARMRRAA